MNKMILIIGVFIITSPQAVCQGPAAYWPFNNNADDLSGNRNNGIIHGNVLPATDRFGNPCGAYHFDGISSYIEVPSSPSLESPVAAFTVTAWYRLDSRKDNHWLTAICKGNSTAELADSPQYRLQVQQNTAIALSTCSPYTPSGSSTISINTDFTECDMNFQDHLFEAGKWNFYALAYDGQKVVAYMNARKVFEFTYSGMLYRNQSPVYIGFDEPGNGEYFEGALDDINIFNRGLTEQEVAGLFNATNTTGPAKEEFEITTPPNKEVNLPATGCTAVVTFDAPTLTQAGCANVSIRQVSGLASGSSFPVGRHLITYEAISASGYEQRCSFYIVVKDITPPVLYIPGDTVIYIKKGEPGVKYVYKQPVADDNCRVRSINLISGNPGNYFFATGEHAIRYKATDVNGNSTEREFVLEIKEEKAGPGSLPQPDSNARKPIDTIPGKEPPPITDKDSTDSIPPDFDKRIKKELDFIEVDSSVLIAKLYDNGVYDGDTVSIFLNQKAVLRKREVSGREQRFVISIDTTRDNELIMYAENLGSIPPNTALLILYDGARRHEINLLSTMSTSGTIRIRKRKN